MCKTSYDFNFFIREFRASDQQGSCREGVGGTVKRPPESFGHKVLKHRPAGLRFIGSGKALRSETSDFNRYGPQHWLKLQ